MDEKPKGLMLCVILELQHIRMILERIALKQNISEKELETTELSAHSSIDKFAKEVKDVN